MIEALKIFIARVGFLVAILATAKALTLLH